LRIDYCALRGPDLYAILYEDRRALCLARADEDDGIVRLIDALDDAAIEGLRTYATTSGKHFEQKRREILAHFFNHQVGRAQRWPRAGH
jgi:uncharacterized damage-inducible protein DinB